GLVGFALGRERIGQAIGCFALAAAFGCALVWLRADMVAEPRLARSQVVQFAGRVQSVDHLATREKVRLLIAPQRGSLPPRVRVSIDEDKFPQAIAPGAMVQMRARLAPPPPMALPGTYDFARDAWFQQIGAVGKPLGPVVVLRSAKPHGL